MNKMANKVTTEDIFRFNELYYKYHTYAQVARETGFSASTVSKYVDKNWKPVNTENIKRFDLRELPDFDSSIFKDVDNYGILCILTTREIEEMKEFWGELMI